MPDAEVKARLSIEQEGEPKAFQDVAAAVGELATAAGSAAPNLEALSTAATTLSGTLQSLATALQSIETAGANTFAPLLAQLDQVITKANNAASALAQLNQP